MLPRDDGKHVCVGTTTCGQDVVSRIIGGDGNAQTDRQMRTGMGGEWYDGRGNAVGSKNEQRTIAEVEDEEPAPIPLEQENLCSLEFSK